MPNQVPKLMENKKKKKKLKFCASSSYFFDDIQSLRFSNCFFR